MAKRKINCHVCGLYLGEIRDATLRKKLTFHCGDPQCEDVDIPPPNVDNASMPNDLTEIFGDAFANIFGTEKK